MIRIMSRASFALPSFFLALVACGADAPVDRGLDGFALNGSDESVTRGSLFLHLSPLSEGNGALEYRLSNIGDTSLRFLPWDTALLGVRSNQFDVRRDDEVVPYVGVNLVVAPPSEEDFAELAPGESRLTTVQLSDLYDMALPGTYSVRARSRDLTPFPSDDAAPPPELVVEASATIISVDADHVREPVQIPKASRPPITEPQDITIHIAGLNEETTFQLLDSAVGNTYAVRRLSGNSPTHLIGANQSQQATQACGNITCTSGGRTTRISVDVTLPVIAEGTPAEFAEVIVASLPRTGCPLFSVDLTLGAPGSLGALICGF